MNKIILILTIILLGERTYSQNDSVVYVMEQDSIMLEIDLIIKTIDEDSTLKIIATNDSITKRIRFISYENYYANSDMGQLGWKEPDSRFVVFMKDTLVVKIIANHNVYHFSNEILIKSFNFCSDPSASMGLCGGYYSEFHNYFVENHYYQSIAKGKGSICSCGFNFVSEFENARINQLLIKLKTFANTVYSK
ncbi:MAG: hypothetical protein ACI8ZX_000741 [Planctomycetota bacterium]|jgi:hypothetical protein